MSHDMEFLALDRTIGMLEEIGDEPEDSLEQPALSDFRREIRDWSDLISKSQNLGNGVHIPDEYPYAIVVLSQSSTRRDKYVAIIDKSKARLVSRYRWRVNVQWSTSGEIKHVYALGSIPKANRRGKKRLSVYLHRLVVRAGAKVVVNHFNRLTLDCRLVNLIAGDFGQNNRHIDCGGRRTRNPGLDRGVERWGDNYGGIIEVRGQKVRSNRKWEDPKRAATWYRRVHCLIHHHECATEAIKRADWPELPELLRTHKIPSAPIRRRRKGAVPFTRETAGDDCPF